MSEKNEWKLAEVLRESLLWTASSLAAVGKEQDVIVLEGRKRTIGEILDEANAALDAPSPASVAPGDAQDDVRDAARYRFARDHIKHGHELPGGYWLSDDGKGWNKTIDAAINSQRKEGGEG